MTSRDGCHTWRTRGFTSADRKGLDISSPATKSTSGIPSALLTYFRAALECASLAGDSSGALHKVFPACSVQSQCEPRTRCSFAENVTPASFSTVSCCSPAARLAVDSASMTSSTHSISKRWKYIPDPRAYPFSTPDISVPAEQSLFGRDDDGCAPRIVPPAERSK